MTYFAEIARLKQEWLSQLEKEADSSMKPIRPPYIIKVLNEKLADDAVISLDVGENCWWFGSNFMMRQLAEDGDEWHFGYYGVSGCQELWLLRWFTRVSRSFV